MNNQRKKKIVEIYFILYLAALVLLIPGKDKDIEGIDKSGTLQRVFQLPFTLKPEKNALNAIVKIDSSGLSIISIDSTNTIFYTGSIKDIKFDVSIEDRNTRQVLAIDNQDESSNSFFSYVTDESTQSLKFYWDPPLYDRKSKTYIVKIIGQGISTDINNEGMLIEDMVQFSLNLNYISDFNSNLLIANDISAENNNELDDLSNGYAQTNINPNINLFLSPREDIVKSVAYTPWENEITIFGLDPKVDLRKQPEIKIIREPDSKIGGTAKIAGFTESGLLIKGETPGYGNMKVMVSMTRHSDGKEAIREFRVIPQLIDEPKFEQVLYPGIRYTFDPKLPLLSNQKTSSLLRSQDGKIYSSNETGGMFHVIPSINDTGKILYFERYVDNNLIGQRYSLKISMFPIPEIIRVSEVGKNTLRILTNCYGTFQGNENYISKIELIQGNAKIKEIIGAQKNDEGKNVFKQIFEIIPLNTSENFSFKIRALAVNGQKSEIFTYTGK
jgi:hypothetical protein